MTVRGFLMCYLGAVVLVGTAGASAYHVLSLHRAQLAARDTAEPSPQAGALPQMAATEPAAPNNDLTQASDVRVSNDSPSAVAPAPHEHTVTLAPHRLPPLRPRVAVADAASNRAAQRDKRVTLRPPARTLAKRPVRHPAVLAAATRPPVPHPLPNRYEPPLRPANGYAEPRPSSGTYYAYPGYPAFRPGYGYYPGYAYYYPRNPYYRVY
jgi:hypothetical protein